MRVKSFLQKTLKDYNVILVLALAFIVSSMLSEVFLNWTNITNILRQLTPLILVSIGMVTVVLTGGIDLSVGSTVAIASVTCALLSIHTFVNMGDLGLVLAIIISLLAGLLFGSITATLVAVFNIAPFVASLAMMTIGRGLAYVITNGQPIPLNPNLPTNQALINFGSNKIPGIALPWPILVALGATLLFWFIFRFTSYGRLTIAIGSNENAVSLSGISAAKYKFIAYQVSGLLCAVAGIVIMSRSGVAVPTTGTGLELDALAACVIGGVSLSGGKGKVINAVVGVLVLGLISNIMNLISVPVYPQQIIKGVIIIIAVLTSGVKKK
ncbi:MAG: ABC transporter permease [Anaerolineaceae bacterium]|nr:ABC transporter permease [Anaerolineaceae bacterium]